MAGKTQGHGDILFGDHTATMRLIGDLLEPFSFKYVRIENGGTNKDGTSWQQYVVEHQTGDYVVTVISLDPPDLRRATSIEYQCRHILNRAFDELVDDQHFSWQTAL